MKLLKLTLMTLLIWSSTGYAADQFTCRVITGDVGDINARGATKTDAYKKAAMECFNRRVALYEGVRGQTVDNAHGEDIINECANVECD